LVIYFSINPFRSAQAGRDGKLRGMTSKKLNKTKPEVVITSCM
jgi:hypothetical protein